MIVTFANQKGGVGKSVLATLFANYLVEQNKSVIIVDADVQKTIIQQRREDAKALNDEMLPYNVNSLFTDEEEQLFSELKNKNELSKLKETMYHITNERMRMYSHISKTYANSVIIVDTPGNTIEDHLVPIFAGSDFIVCPFTYCLPELQSTEVFARLIHKFFKKEPMLIPNRIDKTVGTHKELKERIVWNNRLGEYCIITPKIFDRAEIGRYNTFASSPKQRGIVQDCFDFILSKMYPEVV